MSRTYSRLLWWGLIPALGVLITLSIASLVILRTSHIKSMVVSGMAKHFNLDTSMEVLSIGFLPRPYATGKGLVLRIPNRPDLPPFISIDEFSVDISLFSVWRKHVNTVSARGLKITVPPSGAREGLPGSDDDDETGDGTDSKVIVDHFVSTDAELTFVRKKPGRAPLVFAIHELTVDGIGFGERMPFKAKLTNPIPRGTVETSGSIGPWLKEDGSRTPLEGQYEFTDADLATIDGISGMLHSTGDFKGQLTSIEVNGKAEVPDFGLELGGQPQPLTAAFETIIDGTDGSVLLQRVDATLRQTPMSVKGVIANLPGPGRHEVNLDVSVPNGRVEDILALVIDSPKPVMTGDVQLTTSLLLPAGPGEKTKKLQLRGQFGLAKTSFTNSTVATKLEELSRRSQGKGEDDAIGRVLSNLKGRFVVNNGTATLTRLTFQVPGATVALDGTYGFESGALNFHGVLRMQATVSKAIGGIKSIFIKPFDFIFRKDGAGAIVPIKITGTRENPKFALEVGKVFKRD